MSTGDGSFAHEELREQMLSSAVCVWLKADLETIYKRVRHRKTRPQLLAGDSREILADLLEERSPLYGQAHLMVDSQDESHDITVERVLEGLATVKMTPATAGSPSSEASMEQQKT